MGVPTLDLSSRRIAVVTIDCHRGHLDPLVATLPLAAANADMVIKANALLLTSLRDTGIPVIHVMTSYRSSAEIDGNPWWSKVAGTTATRRNILIHQLPGSPGLEIMPELFEPEDLVVASKKRYDCFMATDLDHALRALAIDTVVLTGINTNSCVLATAISANTRDYAVIVVRDCVDTMDEDLHEASLDIIDRAFGWTLTTQELLDSLQSPVAP